MNLYLQLQIHYIKPQQLDEITIKIHLNYEQIRPTNNINSYLLNHTPRMRFLATHQEIRNYTFTHVENIWV